MKTKQYTPMMTQYLQIKERYPDTLIFFRLGDFYELFFEDAKTASRELELVLTGRDAGVEERVPMCGVPHHAVSSYLERLIKKGYQVGIVEQLEDPAQAKGIVKRDVIQIITPGTLMDVGLEEGKNNFLAGLFVQDPFFILSYCDISTGELGVMTLEAEIDSLLSELDAMEAKELVVSPTIPQELLRDIQQRRGIRISYQANVETNLDYESLLQEIKDIRQIQSLSNLVAYLLQTQKRSLDYLKPAVIVKANQLLQMDVFTRNNLELTRTIRSDDRYGSLLWVLDKTKTAMGARRLKQYLARPLSSQEQLEQRLNFVQAFVDQFLARSELGSLLQEVYDLPRLIARIGYGNANAKDFVQLAHSLRGVPKIKQLLMNTQEVPLVSMAQLLNPLPSLVSLIDQSIVDNPPFTIKEGGMIRPHYHEPLDTIRAASRGGKEWIANFEKTERERTGIKSLKVGFNQVFGFYIEITRSYLDQVKPEFGYERKQTLSGSERFITKELKEKEIIVLHAEETMIAMEYELFLQIREQVKTYTGEIQVLSDYLSELDVLRSFAEAAVNNHYTCPTFTSDGHCNIKEARHPVIEKVLTEIAYVPHDISFDRDHFLQLITGPNMGGKSTYMREVALIVIMAQVGSFVPASSAELPLFDKIFTRIGASDDLVSGQSTFMVEMMEANHAIRNATPHSLILFDEIGRGTSTYDGMALAQAIVEHIAFQVKATTLFSTHYHELTELEQKLPGITNIQVAVFEEKDTITFLYQLKPGSAPKSYGINVARLAHLPDALLLRAQEILKQLETKQISSLPQSYEAKPVVEIPPLWLQELKSLDPLSMTPMDALNYLYHLQKKMK